MRRLRAALWLLVLCALSARGSGGPTGGARLDDYVGGSLPIDRAPFARALTGVQLAGAADDWWGKSVGRYQRAATPEAGGILVLRRSDRLPDGHVAVVTRVLSSRQVLVSQANWVHHRVLQDQPVIEVSARNDWRLVRVRWPPTDQMGIADYPARGFILPGRPVSHDELIAAVPRAVRLAQNE